MSVGFKRGSDLWHIKYPPAPTLCAKWTLRKIGVQNIIIGLIRYKGNYQLRIYERTIGGYQRIRPTIPIPISEAEFILSNLGDMGKCQKWLRDIIAANKQLSGKLSNWQDVISDIKLFMEATNG
jgi:hypothetical protein